MGRQLDCMLYHEEHNNRHCHDRCMAVKYNTNKNKINNGKSNSNVGGTDDCNLSQ